MRIQIAASILGVFVAGGLIFKPVECSARGGAFASGRAVPGPPAAIIRPAIVPPQPVVAPVRARAAPFAHIRLRRVPAVWVAVPWYADYNDSILVQPDEQDLADTTPSPDGANLIPHRLGCTKQNYRVRSEEGGTRTVAVIRC
jgi:hypothetical protein